MNISCPLPVRAYKKAHRSTTFIARRATSKFRSLPTVIIVGAQKAGTSSLFSHLSQHPAIAVSYRKEVHFFDGGLDSQIDNFSRGLNWYRAHFPLSMACRTQKHVLEATPSYLFAPGVPRRIKQLLPGLKILIVLRDPVDRAISHYFHEVRAGHETRNIEDALCNPDLYRDYESRIGNAYYHSALRYSYKSRGVYAPQVERYLTLFGKDNVHVIDSNDLFYEPESTLNWVCDFLQIKGDLLTKTLHAKNVNQIQKHVPEHVRCYLHEYFEPHNIRLFQILGRHLRW